MSKIKVAVQKLSTIIHICSLIVKVLKLEFLLKQRGISKFLKCVYAKWNEVNMGICCVLVKSILQI